MSLSGLLSLIEGAPGYARAAREVRSRGRLRLPLPTPGRPSLVVALQRTLRVPALVITPDAASARTFFYQAQVWTPKPESVVLFPDPDPLFYEHMSADAASAQERLRALALLGGLLLAPEPPLVVASGRALMRLTPPRRWFHGLPLTIRVGDRVDMVGLLAGLVRMGYQPASIVQEPGQFARRGGIIDVYPAAAETPTRLELFGDEVETLRAFDPLTQRSGEMLEKVLVTPATELVPGPAQSEEPLVARAAALDSSRLSEEFRGEWSEELECLRRGESFDAGDFFLPFFSQECLLDWLPPDGLLVLDDGEQVAAAVDELAAQAEEVRREVESRGELPLGFPQPYLAWEDLERRLRDWPGVEFAWTESPSDEDTFSELTAAFGTATSHAGRLRTVLEDCLQLLRDGERVVVVSQQARRLEDLFRERDLYVGVQTGVTGPPAPSSLTLVQGSLGEGFRLSLSAGDLVLLTDSEVFGWSKPRLPVRRRRRARNAKAFVADLSIGDYVVHVEHGVGRFRGLRHMEMHGVQREYLVLEYADGDTLYVPTDQSDRVSRYVGVDEHTPALHRLGGTEWQRAKERVKAAARDVAKELLEIYAAREVVPGHAFSPDTPWQAELETSFPFAETPDQLEAIAEVKRDMESPKPMDRLICGDVGYGKTEVALRAAFKAVNDGYQVAVLVPTTVLAQQHEDTFSARLAAFPVRVEVLSRFRAEREQREVVEGLKLGTVDVVVGTHRLLGSDVEFKKLGLVIIDEEHRFGVMHKERLKQLRKEVDVLTLTATPIPRTLHMALAGVRDLSTMETPPEERLPIKTYVGRYNDEMVREAILRELNRNGQVFFVHNRVQTIDSMCERLERLVPEARFVVGHGQMPEDHLEQTMQEFVAGRYDVLVCSSIIESGLDIPNANTIIVNHADRFGLAQLYQLRGRVGRSSARAYAYLLYGPDRRLTPLAEKRLRAVLEASDLGAGFSIAMRDLEIRGAGNLLGVEQHGQVAAVGFDLYCQLLAQAVQELQGKVQQPALETTVDLPLKAYLPEDYVDDEQQRLSLYQRLARATAADEVGALALELRDRFGPLPEPAVNLLYAVQAKLLSTRAGVAALGVSGDDLVIKMHAGLVFDRDELAQRFGPVLRIGPSQIRLPWRKLGPRWMSLLQSVLEALTEGKPTLTAAARQ